MRKQFANTMETLGQYPDTVILIGDIGHHSLRPFAEKYPNRFYNLGIAEQSLIGVAAGLAMQGFRPYVHTIAPFCTERCFEQIKVDLCYQRVPITIVSVGGSFDYSKLGCTHHCYEDLSILRTLPNLEIYLPGNGGELDSVLRLTHRSKNPVYIKICEDTHLFDFNVDLGEFNTVQNGSKGVIVTNGAAVEFLRSSDLGYTILYTPTITPFSQHAKDYLQELILHYPTLITVEDHSVIGGLGDITADMLQGISHTAYRIGLEKGFLTNYGSRQDLRRDARLSPEMIIERIKAIGV